MEDINRNGWGASAIDAFSTALVMGNKEVVKQILDYVPKINFDQTSTEVSLFETTIRYLGGLLSGEQPQLKSIVKRLSKTNNPSHKPTI